MMDEQPGGERLAALHLKLPPLWPTDPQIWFAQVEAQFTTRGIISQKTKFDPIVALLAPEFATEVRGLILRPPTDHPYDTLKEQLTRRTATTEQRWLQQLFNEKDLGDRTPSQPLRHMQQLLGDKANNTDGAFLCELFLQRLLQMCVWYWPPPQIMAIYTHVYVCPITYIIIRELLFQLHSASIIPYN